MFKNNQNNLDINENTSIPTNVFDNFSNLNIKYSDSNDYLVNIPIHLYLYNNFEIPLTLVNGKIPLVSKNYYNKLINPNKYNFKNIIKVKDYFNITDLKYIFDEQTINELSKNIVCKLKINNKSLLMNDFLLEANKSIYGMILSTEQGNFIMVWKNFFKKLWKTYNIKLNNIKESCYFIIKINENFMKIIDNIGHIKLINIETQFQKFLKKKRINLEKKKKNK